MTVSGVVRILAERGAGILSNNGVTLVSDAGGSLIGNNGAALVSNNGGGLVSNNGAGLISKTKPYRLAPYVLLADAPLAEAPLRDAGVYVTDAAGAVLTDEQGRPVGAVSDGEGRYTLRAQLPSENLVLRIPLRQGGALASVLVQSEKTAREVPIDTAATLASVYVLDRYVQKRAGVFNKLREAEATQLRDSLASTVVSLTSIPEYQTQAVVETTSSLRRSSPAVDQLLETIKVLLLGQERLGEGLPALEVPLAGPSALVDDGAGGFLIAEERPGRLRQVSAAGVL
ncbi:MAG: hypothetical protein VKP62_15245, partial [Candidatus Sericytochromatia bacterium]|nr:hypothetical protein [Candidatus Sericytochromatia bacterium]